ncbi:hypothetical protein D9V29_08485 [Mycetocola manganoxydans]|uniref:Uncharacterized protein n=1 Tax=Mycetocola manganoxydans TaxID=699879 RepID=A0A3L6ZU53_9MICO|nr:hypothetical protein [Mycetocola manganoxydans]RLP71380.1 hypothetical protein D9V29_08485 [Mycetocola manganoxydans]GHD46126.1 hypothetical protein GCM10008097_15790 [Mycetocola manganoxydans]
MSTKKNPDSPTSDAERSWRLHRRLVRIGKAMMLAGVIVVFIHWLAHLEAFGPGQPGGWLDLAVGYPAGGLLAMLGAILAGRKRPKSS